jgi:hypothetical protein
LNPPDQVDGKPKWYAALRVNPVKVVAKSATDRLPVIPRQSTSIDQSRAIFGQRGAAGNEDFLSE